METLKWFTFLRLVSGHFISCKNEGQLPDNLYHINPVELVDLIETDAEAGILVLVFQEP